MENNLMKFDAAAFRAALITKRLIVNRDSMEVASNQIGISKATLSRLESGNTPDLDTFLKCCSWLNNPMDDYIIFYSKTN